MSRASDLFEDDYESPATDYACGEGDTQVRGRDARETVQSGRSVAGLHGLAGGATPPASRLFGDGPARKVYPVYSGTLGYFPAALTEVSRVSNVANEQHNPGEPMHWNRSKSMDQNDTALRHIMDHENSPLDSDGCYHLAKAAWRILARLQIYLEEQGAPKAPLAR